jgi:hypothetical protein
MCRDKVSTDGIDNSGVGTFLTKVQRFDRPEEPSERGYTYSVSSVQELMRPGVFEILVIFVAFFHSIDSNRLVVCSRCSRKCGVEKLCGKNMLYKPQSSLRIFSCRK